MKGQRFATAAAIMALPVSAFAAPSIAAARPAPPHHKAHHGSRPTGKAAHKAHTVRFTARVVRSTAGGLTVRASNGKVLSFSSKQLKRARPAKPQHKHQKSRGHVRRHDLNVQVTSGNVVVNLLGLQPGVVVQITEEFDSNGSVTITITLPPASSTTQQHATGVVSEIEKDALMVHTADGSDLLLHMNADALSNLNLESCQTVDVTYHQDAGLLIADQVNATGASTAGDCAPTYSETGTITQVSSGSLTVSTDHGPVSFTVDLSSGLTDGYKAGDLVNVTYTQNGDGSLTATDLCFVEESASGKVSSVITNAGGGSLTITDDDTGQPDTFVADPQSGVQINSRAFNGVSVGDQVDVTYHQSAGRLVADSVTDH